jgi:hypothetical protein
MKERIKSVAAVVRLKEIRRFPPSWKASVFSGAGQKGIRTESVSEKIGDSRAVGIRDVGGISPAIGGVKPELPPRFSRGWREDGTPPNLGLSR